MGSILACAFAGKSELRSGGAHVTLSRMTPVGIDYGGGERRSTNRGGG